MTNDTPKDDAGAPVCSKALLVPDFVTLKWGTLKSWRMTGEKGKALLKRYKEIGASLSAMTQEDTPEQKEIICQLIDECTEDTIYLEWDGVNVSKTDAKKYVMEYGANMKAEAPK